MSRIAWVTIHMVFIDKHVLLFRRAAHTEKRSNLRQYNRSNLTIPAAAFIISSRLIRFPNANVISILAPAGGRKSLIAAGPMLNQEQNCNNCVRWFSLFGNDYAAYAAQFSAAALATR